MEFAMRLADRVACWLAPQVFEEHQEAMSLLHGLVEARGLVRATMADDADPEKDQPAMVAWQDAWRAAERFVSR
jgi:hypothetical protein